MNMTWNALLENYERYQSAGLVDAHDEVVLSIGNGAANKRVEGVRMELDGKLVLVLNGNEKRTSPKTKETKPGMA